MNDRLHHRPVPVLGDNYVWLLESHAGPEVVVVDPGDADPVVDVVTRRGLQPTLILLTHRHHDHVGGVAELSARWEIPVVGPAADSIPGVTVGISEGDEVAIPASGAGPLRVIAVPGHTAGHVAYLGEETALVGDTLFAGGCGRVFEGSAETMVRSLARLASLPTSTRLYCAHEYTVDNLLFATEVEPGNQALAERLARARELRRAGRPTVPSTLAEELATNPFLRCGEAPVVAAASRVAGRDTAPGVDTFAVIRGWKDRWRPSAGGV